MMRTHGITLLLILFILVAQAQQIENIQLPEVNPGERVTNHTGISLLYVHDHKQSKWVAYMLTSNMVNARVAERTDRFTADPKIRENTNFTNDYRGSGYDRGHLAPAADMRWSHAAMEESFYFSNMSPQSPPFNRGIWNRLEQQVRDWAVRYDTIYIVTGPVLTGELRGLGTNRVSIPEMYYKAILVYTAKEQKGIGFLMSNQGSGNHISQYAVSIDSVQAVTGINFFHQLSDSIQDVLEQNYDQSRWIFSSSTSPVATSSSSPPVATSDEVQPQQRATTQCKGTTQQRERCRNMTSNENGYCHVHQAQVGGSSSAPAERVQPERRTTSVQCSGTTRSGTRCRNRTNNSNGRCHLHGGN